MSEYGYEERPRRARRTREREPEYVTETTYIERGGKGAPVRDLVYRPKREDSIEDIPRDFPPPGAEYRQTKFRETYEPARRPRSVYEEEYAAYGRNDRGRPRDDYRDGYYSEDEHYDRPRPQRRKSIVDKVKDFGEAAGLGGVIGAVTGQRSRSRSRPRHERGYDSDRYGDDYSRDGRRSSRYDPDDRSRSRSKSRGKRTEKKWEQAAKAAVIAGAVEAFRSRKTPGPWTGEKGQRIATAALGAAGIDGLIDRDPSKNGKRHIAESAIGGLVANRLANGSRSKSRGRGRDDSQSPDRSRSRSRSIFGRGRSKSRGRDSDSEDDKKSHTVRNVAGAGAVIAAGKALYDRARSKSRSRRDRSRSVSSSDSYVPSRNRGNRAYSRGRSMDNDQGNQEVSRANPDRRLAAPQGKRDGSASSESSTDMEKQRKKLRGKELLTAGLASVATIHAAHGVYSSMVASENRRKLVSEGEMSPDEARKRKSKNMLQDAAAVGIAALGIKSAYSEWKDMNEQRQSVKELEKRRRKRRKERERREREARQNTLGGMNAPMANPYGYPVAHPAYAPTYENANPYGVPPPPIGHPPSARY